MADETPAPLSDAEIHEIAERYYEPLSAVQWAEVKTRISGRMSNLEYYDDAPHVVVRLLTTLAAYREIVAAVAKDNGPLVQDQDYCTWECAWCEYDAEHERPSTGDRDNYVHSPTCPVTRARALLGDTGQ